MKHTLAAIASILLCAVSARGEIKTQTVRYKEGDTELQGYLAYDDSVSGKRPGVMVVHEWWGLEDYTKSRTEQLAKLGYVAFAADIYGNGQHTQDPQEAGKLAGQYKSDRALLRRRAEAGLAELKKQPNVDPGKVAAIGYCFGGTTVLELSRGGADLAGVVSFHGGLDLSGDAKNVKAKTLVCHGDLDTFVSDEQLAAFRQQMRDAKADFQMIIYSGAVHGFTNPANKKSTIKGVAYNAVADRLSWQVMQDFFAEIFRAPVRAANAEPAPAGANGKQD